jgi:peptidoglycan/xylan/chitin deacetylase (PgdA/CDA1 family)
MSFVPQHARHFGRSGLAVMRRLSARRSAAPGRAAVLCCHRVVPRIGDAADVIPTLLISAAMLERYIDWLGRRRRFVPLDDIGAAVEEGRPLDGLAAVTFDDGYADNYEAAFPLLKRKGIPAAFFVVSDHVGSDRPLMHDRLYATVRRAAARWVRRPDRLRHVEREFGLRQQDPAHLATSGGALQMVSALQATRRGAELERFVAEAAEGDEPAGAPLMTWSMLREMDAAGMTIGSHTRSHPLLPMLGSAALLDELAGSRAAIEAQLGKPVRHCAYPGGRFNRRALESVARAGYRFGFTACDHRDPGSPHLAIPRLLIWERSCIGAGGGFSPSVLSCRIRGLRPFASSCSEDHSGDRAAAGRPPQFGAVLSQRPQER